MNDGGDCYEAAAEFLVLRAAFRHPHGVECPEGAVLVHGRPTLQRAPFVPFGHAWIEVAQTVEVEGREVEIATVIDVANGRHLEMPKALYYAVGRIDPSECFRYTRDEALAMLGAFRHYGPWEGPEGCPPIEEDDDDSDA